MLAQKGYPAAVVISKNSNKGALGTTTPILGVATLQQHPYSQRWKHENLL